MKVSRIRRALTLGFLFGANLWPLLAHPVWAPVWLTAAVAMCSIVLALRLGGAR